MGNKQRWIIGVCAGLIALKLFFPNVARTNGVVLGAPPVDYLGTIFQIAGIAVVGVAVFILCKDK